MSLFAQEKSEKEIKIKEKDFPQDALKTIRPFLQDAKRLRYYQEFDLNRKSFELKFKKNKRYYSLEFDQNGRLEDVEVIIKLSDIPQSISATILKYITANYSKPQLKKIQQQYPNQLGQDKTVLNDAFANNFKPYINYEIVISCICEGSFKKYELLFGANGNFKKQRLFKSAAYDHILFQ